jgi:hypothetical protein
MRQRYTHSQLQAAQTLALLAYTYLGFLERVSQALTM